MALIPDLIDVGVDILDPVQMTAAGMDPAALKAQYGDRLCFHGGIDVQEVLPHFTPDELRSEVCRLYNILGKNGGYIIAPSHNIQVDTPIENIIAMYDEIAPLRKEKG